jgi:nitrite reductase (NO-forming)
MKKVHLLVIAGLVLALVVAACGNAQDSQTDETGYILTTGLKDGKLAFIGVGGDIEDIANPALKVNPGQQVTITVIDGEGAPHDIFFPIVDAKADRVSSAGKSTTVTFTAPSRDGAFEYYDTVPGHAEAGMAGYLVVGSAVAPQQVAEMQMFTSGDSVISTGLTVSYALETGLQDGKMVFMGKGGDIDGKANPELMANVGDTVEITLTSGEGAEHNFVLDEFGVDSQHVVGQGNFAKFSFVPDQPGTFAYYCSLAGHRAAGMEGEFIVMGEAAAAANGSGGGSSVQAALAAVSTPAATTAPADPSAVDIVRDPTDIPTPIGSRGPENVRIDLEATEVVGQLGDGTTYTYWTFNGKVPGPFFRMRVGDTADVHMKNSLGSTMTHSVDFHAVTGPGGGAVMTQTAPGQETTFSFQALNPGLYVYHCATPLVPQHISNGMYGLILVEPEGGLPPVDREFYVMQGELYTAEKFGTQGQLAEDTDKLLNETPEYFTFNGASMALTSDAHSLKANSGETVRIFFGVGGPNFTSSFHVIGEIFDRVYNQASLTGDPLTDVQTTTVPPGGATMVEFKVEVPGRYVLVDHALSRLARGLAGYLIVEGEPVPDIFSGTPTAGSGH